MPVETKCAWCGAILIDTDHAKQHVAEKCEKAPWKKRIEALGAELAALRKENDGALADGRVFISGCDTIPTLVRGIIRYAKSREDAARAAEAELVQARAKLADTRDDFLDAEKELGEALRRATKAEAHAGALAAALREALDGLDAGLEMEHVERAIRRGAALAGANVESCRGCHDPQNRVGGLCALCMKKRGDEALQKKRNVSARLSVACRALREVKQWIADNHDEGSGPFHCKHGTHLFLAGGCSECSPPDLPNRSTKPPFVPEIIAVIDDALAGSPAPSPTYNHTRGDSSETPCPQCADAPKETPCP